MRATRERITEVAAREFSARWYDDVTLRGIAAEAGVALQTVRNHFAAKEELFSAAAERIHRDIESARWTVEPGDLEEAFEVLVADYERTGDATLRMLAVEGRVAVVRPVLQRGRKGHRAWVEHVFGPALARLRGAARERRVAQLVVATDVYAWKLLRRDVGLSRAETKRTMRELAAALNVSGRSSR